MLDREAISAANLLDLINYSNGINHDNRVFSFGDRIIHMNDGRIDKVENTR